MRTVLEMYDIKDKGPIDNKNLYVLNENATLKKIIEVMTSIRMRMKENPDKNFLVIYVLAGHGMICDGKQVVLLNEYSSFSGFYKFWGIESDVRDIAHNFANSYQICLFACCRNTMNSDEHCGGFRSKQEA